MALQGRGRQGRELPPKGGFLSTRLVEAVEGRQRVAKISAPS